MIHFENTLQSVRAGATWTMQRQVNATGIVRGLLIPRGLLVDRGLAVERGLADDVAETRQIEAYENEGGHA
jgi:hypothetical protein